MTQRLNAYATGNKAVNALHALGQHVNNASLDKGLLELIYFRVSQINNCAFCLDMHAKDLRAKGETEQRLYMISAWRECPFYTARERAALAFAEELTTIKSGLVADDVYNELKSNFSEEEMVDLAMAIVTINSYNRINIAFGAAVGAYEVEVAQ